MKVPVKKNQEYIVDIIDNGFEGEGIAKINEFTIFIPNSLKGEKVKILILKVISSYAFGKVIEIINKKESNNFILIGNLLVKNQNNKPTNAPMINKMLLSVKTATKNEIKNKKPKDINCLCKNASIVQNRKLKNIKRNILIKSIADNNAIIKLHITLITPLNPSHAICPLVIESSPLDSNFVLICE